MSLCALISRLKHATFGAAGIVLLTVAAFKTHLNLASAIPLFLFAVVLQSLSGDFVSSLLIAALSAVSLDFFFTEPLFSLYMSNPRSVLALWAFSFTALVITQLVSKVRKEAVASQAQKERLDRLYRLSQDLLQLDPEAAAKRRLLQPFAHHFAVTALCIFDAESSDLHVIGQDEHGLAERTRDAYIRGGDWDEPEFHVSTRCIRRGGRLTGAIGFQGLRDPAETAGPLTALTATFLERTIAFRKASEAAAAAQAEVYRSAVLDALAHEFKTPLATILAAAGGLREAGPLEDAQSELAETVESEAARLGSLTSRLLRTARLEKEDIKPLLEATDLRWLIGPIARQYGQRSRDRQIVFMDSADPVEVPADQELLRLAIGQLVENACKYSDVGSTVTIKITSDGEFAVVRVWNDGSSIPRNEQHQIFERFYRGAGARRSTSGSGLGLYVARKIAVAHGGDLKLEAESAPSGVTFSLKLPIASEFSQSELTHAAAAQ